MAHLLLVGPWNGAMDVAREHAVTLVHRLEDLPVRSPGFHLMAARIGDAEDLDIPAIAEAARGLGIPWLACGTGPEIEAYRAGALAVLPGDAPPALLQETLARHLARLSSSGEETVRRVPPGRWQRRYRSGERIEIDPESTLEVQEGVLALTVIHEDGAEVLLGLYGPGHVLAGHPEDGCCLQLYTHTDARVHVQPWAEAVRRPGFSERLRDRLRYMEAWAAMQARPQIEQRLMGILALLGEQFGRATPRGLLIEVRITHVQLASAVGATRATVTRRLGLLRRRGLLSSVASGNGERFCLRSWDGRQHAPARA